MYPVPFAPGTAWMNIAIRREITALGAIPTNPQFTAPVLVDMEAILKNTLPKLSNLVSEGNILIVP
jgi:hypothetical protein